MKRIWIGILRIIFTPYLTIKDVYDDITDISRWVAGGEWNQQTRYPDGKLRDNYSFPRWLGGKG